MRYTTYIEDEQGVAVELSRFGVEGGFTEWHAMLHVEPRGEAFEGQYRRLCEAEEAMMRLTEMEGAVPVCKRYFLSDATNQQPLIAACESAASLSCIGQPPLDGSKVVLWVYLQRGTDVRREVVDGMPSTIVRHGGYEHIWTMGMTRTRGDSYEQTRQLVDDYARLLTHYGATVADHCQRTWFFVRDVDSQYGGLVRARRECFARMGLTTDTHYISSTGIGGSPAQTEALVQMGCYALKGTMPEQVRYLYAPSHLNRTSDYGVTFERGTRIDLDDRSHVFISGTASIDNEGRVVHVGDVVRQTQRMWENVEALLAEGGMDARDMTHIVVYLRDMADYATVRSLFERHYPEVPTVFTLAPVCRPAWLIEMECMAIRELR